MMKNRLLHLSTAVLTAIMAASLITSVAVAQSSGVALPIVSSAAVPLYPPIARAAGVQGLVRVKVTTDGERIVTAEVEEGPQMLSAAAVENIRTWHFAPHQPTTFVVNYRYTLDSDSKGNPDNPTVILRLPTEVEVIRTPFNTRDLPPEVR